MVPSLAVAIDRLAPVPQGYVRDQLKIVHRDGCSDNRFGPAPDGRLGLITGPQPAGLRTLRLQVSQGTVGYYRALYTGLEARHPEIFLQAPHARCGRDMLLRLPSADGAGVGADRPGQRPPAESTMCAVQHQALPERCAGSGGAVAQEVHDGRVVPDPRFTPVLFPVRECEAVDAQLWCNLPLQKAEFQASALEMISQSVAFLQPRISA